MIAARALGSRLRAASRRGLRAARGLARKSAPFARFAWRLAKPPLRRIGRLLKRVGRPLAKGMLRLAALGERLVKWLVRRLRAAAAIALRATAALDRRLRRVAALLTRAARRAWREVTLPRAALALVLASAAVLLATQFLDYRAIEIGQPGYAGLPSIAEPPRIEARTAGEAHAYAMIPVALLAAAFGALALRGRRRTGAAVALLGLLALAIALAIDLPAGLDEGTASIRFAGASATLLTAFYAQLAACCGLMLGGLLLYRRPRTTNDNARKPYWLGPFGRYRPSASRRSPAASSRPGSRSPGGRPSSTPAGGGRS